MKFKDIDGCDSCPLMAEGICCGGMSSDANGPIETPCMIFGDDDDVYSLINSHDYSIVEQEKQIEAEEKKKEEKERKRKITNARKRMSRWAVIDEQRSINYNRKLIDQLNRNMNYLLAKAKTDEMFGYQVDSGLGNQIQGLRDELDKRYKIVTELTNTKMSKLKKLRASERYKNAGK